MPGAAALVATNARQTAPYAALVFRRLQPSFTDFGPRQRLGFDAAIANELIVEERKG